MHCVSTNIRLHLLFQQHLHRFEGFAVNFARAVFLEHLQMLGRAVTFVRIEAIHQIFLMHLTHDPVPRDFGHDRCGRDGFHQPVSAYHRFLFITKIRNFFVSIKKKNHLFVV